VRIGTGNRLKHELVKSAVVYLLKKKGYECYTEAKWGNGWSGITDVFVPAIPCYIEILDSETDALLKRKCVKYPNITQLVIRTKDMSENISEWKEYLEAILP
jgi:hypothetical protein